jgi:putative inorganic carbon (HCO3(-)) transporter
LIALVAGIGAALLPPTGGLLLVAVVGLCIIGLIEPRIALIATLVIAPLKVLTETELPLAGALPLDIGQLSLLLTILIWLVHSIAVHRQLGLTWTPILAPLLLFIFAASLTLWTTVDSQRTFKELIQWAEIIVMIVLTVAMTRDGNFELIVAGLIAAAVAQAIIGIYEFFGGSGVASLWMSDFQHFRAFGTFGQPNPFGAFMGFMLPLTLGLALGAAIEAYRAYHDTSNKFPALIQSLRPVILYLLSAVIIGAGLLVSWSRGAWIGFGGAMVMLMIFAPPRRWIGITLVVLGLIGGLFAAQIGLLPASVVSRLSDFSQDLTSIQDVRGQVISDANYAVLERLAHWQAAIGMATDHPWLGIGFGSYETAYPRYQLMNWPYPLGHAHNYYLNLLAETGIIGLICYLVAWIAIFALTIRVLRRETGVRWGLALGLLGTWTHLTVHSFFDNLFVNNMYLHLGVMLGLIGGLLLTELHDRAGTW